MPKGYKRYSNRYFSFSSSDWSVVWDRMTVKTYDALYRELTSKQINENITDFLIDIDQKVHPAELEEALPDENGIIIYPRIYDDKMMEVTLNKSDHGILTRNSYPLNFSRPDHMIPFINRTDARNNSFAIYNDYLERVVLEVQPGGEEIISHSYTFDKRNGTNIHEVIKKIREREVKTRTIMNRLGQNVEVSIPGERADTFEYYPGGQLKRL